MSKYELPFTYSHPDLSEYFTFIKNIYVFSHLKTYLIDPDRQEKDKIMITVFLTITSLLCGIIAFKILIIFLYFILIQTITHLCSCYKSFSLQKCKLSFVSTFSKAFIYIKNIIKRTFTYNFYIYDNIIIGVIYYIIYFAYLIFTFIYLSLVHEHITEEIKPISFNICYTIALELNLLIEIMCIVYYHIRHIEKHFIMTWVFFILMNGTIFVLFKLHNVLIDKDGLFIKDEFKRVVNLIINSCFLIMNLSTFINIVLYDVNKEAMKVFLQQQEKFFKENKYIDASNVMTDIIAKEQTNYETICKAYKIENVYFSDDNNQMKISKYYNII